MTLATTVSLPVIRGPAVLAKALTAIDVLSGGRLIAGVGPGSSAADYGLVGVPFDDRWRRFDEALRVLRTLVGTDDGTGAGGPQLEPRSPRRGESRCGSPAGAVPPGCGGSPASATAGSPRRTTSRPSSSASAWHTLRQLPTADGRPLPHALATTWTYVTEVPADAERMLTDTLAPLLNRSVESLRHLPIGSAEVCAQRLTEFAAAGLERVLLWPLADEMRQLELIRERVIPLVAAAP